MVLSYMNLSSMSSVLLKVLPDIRPLLRNLNGIGLQSMSIEISVRGLLFALQCKSMASQRFLGRGCFYSMLSSESVSTLLYRVQNSRISLVK